MLTQMSVAQSPSEQNWPLFYGERDCHNLSSINHSDTSPITLAIVNHLLDPLLWILFYFSEPCLLVYTVGLTQLCNPLISHYKPFCTRGPNDQQAPFCLNTRGDVIIQLLSSLFTKMIYNPEN